MIKIMSYVILYFLLLIASPAFAGQPATGLDNEPSVDSAAAVVNEDHSKPAKDGDMEAAASDQDTSEAASSYVYDLKKLIIKSRENIKRVNDKIKEQSVVKRNQKREERAREYYEKGMELQDEGKFDQAREYFEKAINITEHPEMTKYINQSAEKLKAQEIAIKRQEKQQVRLQIQEKQVKLSDAAGAYEQAVAYYKEKKYKEAKEMFSHVQELSDNYKGTNSYLRIIDQNIIQTEVALSKADQKEEARQQEEAQRARQREKEAWHKEIEQKEKDRKNQINAQADTVYNEAVSLYKNKKYMEAKKKFEEVEWVVPDYKASRNYIARADKDMAAEQARVDQIKAKELALQQWEEEVAKRKKEALEQKEAQEKEKQRIKQLEEQVAFVYQAAVNLFDKKTYDESLEKFNDVDKTLPGYRSTKAYIAKIALIKEKDIQKQAQIAEMEKKRQAQEEARKQKQDMLAKEAEARRKAKEEEILNREAQRVKKEAVRVEQAKQPEQKPEVKKNEEKKSEIPPIVQEPSKTVLTKEQEIDEAKIIESLAQRSAQVLQKISMLAEDKRMAPVKKKMAKVDEMLNRIKQQKESILRQLREDEERERKRQEKIAHEQRMAQIKYQYDEAIIHLRNQKFEEAYTSFLQIETDSPNYKMTRWYLAHIKEDAKQAERQAVLERTIKEEDRLQALEAKRQHEAILVKAAEEERRRAEEERRRQLRQAQESEIQTLADKAVNLNDEILAASKAKDFNLAKAKFSELESLLETLEALKRTIVQEDNKESQEKAKPKERPEQKLKEKTDVEQKPIEPKAPVVSKTINKKLTPREVLLKDRKERQAQAKAMLLEEAQQEKLKRAERLAAEKAKRERQDYEQVEIERSKDEVFDHAIALYKAKKYTAAKVIFDDLSNHGYKAAKAYSIKIERYYEKVTARASAAHERERSLFIAEQIRKQKMANALAQKERARQVELNAQFERQRRYAEESGQREKIRMEALRLKERENRRLDEERAREQRKREKEDEELMFRRVPLTPAAQEQPVKVEESKPVKPISMDEAESVQNNDKARQEQVEFSNKRKKHFEDQHARELIEKRKDQLKQEAEARKQQEADRKNQLAKAKMEEQQRKIELKKQKEQEIIENKKKEELAKKAKEHQKQLEDERKAIEQRLNESASAIYEEAMGLYKKENYEAAYNKLKDLEDILPDFKQTRKFMEQAKTNMEKPVPVTVPVSSMEIQAPVSQSPVTVDKRSDKTNELPPVDRDEAIKKTLEVFDSP